MLISVLPNSKLRKEKLWAMLLIMKRWLQIYRLILRVRDHGEEIYKRQSKAWGRGQGEKLGHSKAAGCTSETRNSNAYLGKTQTQKRHEKTLSFHLGLILMLKASLTRYLRSSPSQRQTSRTGRTVDIQGSLHYNTSWTWLKGQRLQWSHGTRTILCKK